MKLDNEDQREILLLALGQIPLKGRPEEIRAALQEVDAVKKAVQAAEIETVKTETEKPI